MTNIFYPLERRSDHRYFDNYGYLFNGFFDAPTTKPSVNSSRSPAMDISETDMAYLVRAEMPGIRKEDLDVTVDDGYLLIEAGQVDQKDESDNVQVIRQERRVGKFSRSVRLSSDIDAKDISAEYRDGVLQVKLPKAKEARARKVEVQVG